MIILPSGCKTIVRTHGLPPLFTSRVSKVTSALPSGSSLAMPSCGDAIYGTEEARNQNLAVQERLLMLSIQFGVVSVNIY
jgi:hypothetical protein